ncbi:hypothetical protein [Streptomyces sp. NBC_00624]|uniref:hypothetical protein n=1 Tax=Streptomyces sp. NBC_00624 TaxID=2975791 RepID=UPI00386DBFDE
MFVVEPDHAQLVDHATRLRGGRLKPIVCGRAAARRVPTALVPDHRTPGRTNIRVTED